MFRNANANFEAGEFVACDNISEMVSELVLTMVFVRLVASEEEDAGYAGQK